MTLKTKRKPLKLQTRRVSEIMAESSFQLNNAIVRRRNDAMMTFSGSH